VTNAKNFLLDIGVGFARLTFGPFNEGDFIDFLYFYFQSESALVATTYQAAMVFNVEELAEEADESFTGRQAVSLVLGVSSQERQVPVCHRVGRNRYLQLVVYDSVALSGSVAIGYFPVARGRRRRR
jgi:hypothetical protein